MAKILVTGGTVFVSRFTAAYFLKQGHEVWVLNRNTRPQVPGVNLIAEDRHNLGDKLKKHCFDAVLDICAYTRTDVRQLVRALGKFGTYIFISSSAVYPETLPRPFREDMVCGPNSLWGAYGTNKLEAENWLLENVPGAYILRPPYIYGPMQNVYREGFVFDCARQGRTFCLPGAGEMPLQFFHVEDLCRFLEILLEKKPEQRIFNVGNPETVTIRRWAELCYDAVGVEMSAVSVAGHSQRYYFPFYDYDYALDVSAQMTLMPQVKNLEEGLRESWQWYRDNSGAVARKPLLDYIDREIFPVKFLIDSREKEEIATSVLQALPQWFGIPESVANYVAGCRNMPFWAVFQNERPLGFVALKKTGPAAAEIFVMGIVPEAHHRGLGRRLIETLEDWAREQGYLFLQVKTVRMGCWPEYDGTNRFYRAVGFHELECIPELWDPQNPCQLYIKYIGK